MPMSALLDGGRYRWQAEGRPLVTDMPAPAPAVHYRPVARREPMRIHRDEVLAALGDEAWSFSMRARPRNTAASASAGRAVPTSARCATAEFRARAISTTPTCSTPIRASSRRPSSRRCSRARGVGPEHEVIAYCRMSHRATVVAFRADAVARLHACARLRRIVDRVGQPGRRAGRALNKD